MNSGGLGLCLSTTLWRKSHESNNPIRDIRKWQPSSGVDFLCSKADNPIRPVSLLAKFPIATLLIQLWSFRERIRWISVQIFTKPVAMDTKAMAAQPAWPGLDAMRKHLYLQLEYLIHSPTLACKRTKPTKPFHIPSPLNLDSENGWMWQFRGPNCNWKSRCNLEMASQSKEMISIVLQVNRHSYPHLKAIIYIKSPNVLWMKHMLLSNPLCKPAKPKLFVTCCYSLRVYLWH